jgi:hypothetical protein
MSWIWLDYDGIPALVEANYFSPDKKRLVTITGDKATLVCRLFIIPGQKEGKFS